MVVYAYTIDKKNIDVKTEFIDKLFQKISNSKIKERMRKPNNESDESDFALFCQKVDNHLFGLMINMGKGHVEEIPVQTLDKNQARLLDLEKDIKEHIAGFKKNMYYFCIYRNILILSGNKDKSMKSFDLYVNWLFELLDDRYYIHPMISDVKEDNLRLDNIKTIEIDNVILNNYDESNNENVTFKKEIFNLSNKFKNFLIKKLRREDTNIAETDIRDIIDAKVIFTIKKSKKGSNIESLKKALKVLDTDYVKIIDKKGRKISSENILEKRNIPLKYNNDNYIDEGDLMRKMADYIKEII
ncbi:hypothetical protein [Brachyspira hyodysenteriae]|nr:hypothetical protein [Brachyspira hyodysenteriae]KLI15204.1 hypothetical protein SU46_10025 [Brachyspira hyodysenteriae]KLI33100.1 hypothetical protein SZ49_00245 [Brachyspira hyodysenteriae]